jgi:hypothetical protein
VTVPQEITLADIQAGWPSGLAFVWWEENVTHVITGATREDNEFACSGL